MKLLILLVMLFTPFISHGNNPTSKRLLLSALRNGDYAHAGDEDAIDLVIRQLLVTQPHIKKGKVLDVGCGFGGTLGYLKTKGFTSLYGIDIHAEAIHYAQAKYSGITFETLNAFEAYRLGLKFDLIVLFNSVYAIHDKKKLLQVLNEISNPNAILVIFDYSAKDYGKTLDIKDFSGKPMYPIQITPFLEELRRTHWELLEIQDLSGQFFTWYDEFLTKLDQQRKALESTFSQSDIEQVEDSFTYFCSHLKTGKMGGVVIYAHKK